MLYVDNTGFGKLLQNENFIIVLAGNGVLIERWKNWFKSDISKPFPDVETGDAFLQVAIINKDRNELIFSSGVHLPISEHRELKALFSGSGRKYAARRWRERRCAKESVSAAIAADCYTGGEVRFIDFNHGGLLNIEDTVNTIKEVNQTLLKRGLIMDMNNPGRKHRPLTNEEVESIRNLVANGDITPSAPTLQSSPWTTEKRQQLNDAINTMRHHQKEGC
ncbi:hypothetical protein OYQ83_002154 [Salmonella enterica]|nr:hypothetical protein [Salmonella enterica]EKF3202413.1 hypothetical protein [Salmonella enterica]EMC4932211.1 hypothetical protein [Salmonella enterica]